MYIGLFELPRFIWITWITSVYLNYIGLFELPRFIWITWITSFLALH